MTVTRTQLVDEVMTVAGDIADGRLDPAALERRAAEACTDLMTTTFDPHGPIREAQVAVARGVLAAGWLTADEVAEWAAVLRRAEATADPADSDSDRP
ncbi:flagellar hook-length control protein [Nocardia sp. NPDC049190]|uniref:flagellar hook-length control protein n=1 Tax=Nocardia sp. NPDC049190 TaxID=3155650 RepID=UPI0034058C80